LFSMAASSGCATMKSLISISRGDEDDKRTVRLICSVAGDTGSVLVGVGAYNGIAEGEEGASGHPGLGLFSGLGLFAAGEGITFCICHGCEIGIGDNYRSGVPYQEPQFQPK